MLLCCVRYNNPKTYVRVYASFELCGRTTNIAKEYQRLYVVIVRGLIYRVCFNSGNTKAWWGQGETMCWSKIEWRVPSKGSSKGTSRSLALCVIYLWDKNPHFSNRLLKSEVISINKINTGCNTFVKYQAISNYYFLFFVVAAASGSGGSLCPIRIWVQTKHEHCSQGIVSSSCECTVSAGCCSWCIFRCLTAWATENPCKETPFTVGMPFFPWIIHLS